MNESHGTEGVGQRPGPAGARHGVVFVHGVGTQRKSETLLQLGLPLLDWLARWDAACGATRPHVQATELSFAPVDVGGPDDILPHAALDVSHGSTKDTWVFTEAWWASSNFAPGFGTMLAWSVRYLWDIIDHLWSCAAQRVRRLLGHERDTTLPSAWARWVDLLNCLGLLILYPLGAILGYVVLIPLMLLSQLPIPVLQNFVLTNMIRPFLVINAGEFRTYLTDDIQAANIHHRVERAVTWLCHKSGGACDDVTIVAHSEGCVVSFGMLSDPDPALKNVHAKVRKLITMGAGLNKSWQIAPALERLHGPLPEHIHWVDLWGSYDPVPAGWLQPPRLPDGDWAPIFRPSEQLAREQGLTRSANPDPYNPSRKVKGRVQPQPVYWPVSIQVTNAMNVVSDHGAYWANDEQVLVRLAAEIDAPFYQHSRYWTGDRPLAPGEAQTPQMRQAVRARRERVSVLALGRAVAVFVAVLASGIVWSSLIAQSGVGALLTPLNQLRAQSGLAGLLITVVNWLHHIPAQPLSGLLDGPLALPFSLIGALLICLIVMIVFTAIRTLTWDRWDQRASAAAMKAIATAGQDGQPAIRQEPATAAGAPA